MAFIVSRRTPNRSSGQIIDTFVYLPSALSPSVSATGFTSDKSTEPSLSPAYDGKIFVTNVEDVMRVRTGEVGVEALAYKNERK